MEKYVYKGDFMPVDIDKTPYIFADGKEYELPEDNKKVKSLIRLGKLKKVKTAVKKGAKQ